ncbi:MAG: hypothetical protein QM778_13880 [Myxococcales bacterium]
MFGTFVPKVEREYETADGIAAFEEQPPHVLLLGSSYVRSFGPVVEAVAREHPGRTLSMVPIEGGRFLSYQWLLEHRIGPLIDQNKERADAPRLERIVLVTNLWDACGDDDYPNLPARAWTLGDYVSDLFEHGVTAYNSNYVDWHVSEATRWSVLAQDRGVHRIPQAVRRAISPKQTETLAEDKETRVQGSIDIIAECDLEGPKCDSRVQLAALQGIADFARARQLPLTVVLWPTMPITMADKSRRAVDHFRAKIQELAPSLHAEVFDWSYASPLVDADFRPDYDHLEPWGDEKFGRWAMQGPLASQLRSEPELSQGQLPAAP